VRLRAVIPNPGVVTCAQRQWLYVHQSKVETLVLSHFMARSLKDWGNSLEKISLQITGEIIFAEDLQSLALGKSLK